MTWLLLIAAGVAMGLAAGRAVWGRRERSPVQEYEKRERRRERESELAAVAGTMDEVRLLLARGNKIAAIKAYREQTNSGLREAKDAVDALEHETRADPK
jgi:ribosomal protein L7/L12